MIDINDNSMIEGTNSQHRPFEGGFHAAQTQLAEEYARLQTREKDIKLLEKGVQRLIDGWGIDLNDVEKITGLGLNLKRVIDEWGIDLNDVEKILDQRIAENIVEALLSWGIGERLFQDAVNSAVKQREE